MNLYKMNPEELNDRIISILRDSKCKRSQNKLMSETLDWIINQMNNNLAHTPHGKHSSDNIHIHQDIEWNEVNTTALLFLFCNGYYDNSNILQEISDIFGCCPQCIISKLIELKVV